MIQQPAQTHHLNAASSGLITPGFNWICFLAFIAGSVSWHKTVLIGELYTTEIVIFFTAILVSLSNKGKLAVDRDLFTKFIIYGVLLLMGYMLSDLIGQSAPSMYLRGWGRVALVIIDLWSMTIILGAQRNTIIWFYLGYAIGNIGILLLENRLNMDTFKFYWAIPVLLLICCGMPLRSLRMTAITLIVFGLVYIKLDYRSAGAIAFILGAIMYLRLRKKGGKVKIMPLLLAGLVAVFTIKAVLNMTDDRLETRRATSSLNRFAAISVGIQAIIDSPIIGYGSWGNNTSEYAKELYEQTKDEMKELGQRYHRQGSSFGAHSQIIQAWMEGGILAAAFFIFLGSRLYRAIRYVLLDEQPGRYTALYALNLIFSLWHLFMSPFGGDHRIDIACSIGIISTISIYLMKDNVPHPT